MKPLRFAPMIRVSTERQDKQGESLLTQKTQIKQHVKFMKGVIPGYCWKYVGQEHSTPDYERNLLDQLLEDSEKDLFDAVIVADSSRWSRDNLKNEIGLRTLRDNRIRFFASTTDYDLNENTQFMHLQMAAIINEFLAKEQAKKSVDNRHHRSQRGIPAVGPMPYARKFNKKTNKWELDEEKANQIREVAKKYLSGEDTLINLAKSLQMSYQNLSKILTKRCGNKWTVQFKGKEPVTYTIPRILSNDMIRQVKDRLEFKRTNNRTDIKNKYLLSGFIRCEKCGSTLTGQTQYSKKAIHKYYQHQSRTIVDCTAFSSIPAEKIERALFLTIFENIVDVPSFEKAIAESLPDREFA